MPRVSRTHRRGRSCKNSTRPNSPWLRQWRFRNKCIRRTNISKIKGCCSSKSPSNKTSRRQSCPNSGTKTKNSRGRRNRMNSRSSTSKTNSPNCWSNTRPLKEPRPSAVFLPTLNFESSSSWNRLRFSGWTRSSACKFRSTTPSSRRWSGNSKRWRDTKTLTSSSRSNYFRLRSSGCGRKENATKSSYGNLGLTILCSPRLPTTLPSSPTFATTLDSIIDYDWIFVAYILFKTKLKNCKDH